MPPVNLGPAYAAYHQRMIAAIRAAMYRRWPPTTDRQREQLEKQIAFFDKECTYEMEMAEGLEPEDFADDEIDAAI